MNRFAPGTSLQSDENDCSHHRDEVERQIHDISDDCAGAEPLKGALDDLAKFGNGVLARLQFSALGDKAGGVVCHEGSVEGVEQGIPEHPVFGEHGYDGGALVEHEENCRQDSHGTIYEDEHC